MKNFYLKTLLLLAFSIAGITASAYDYCEVNGICYGLSDNEAYVTFRTDPDKRDFNQSGDYSGDIVIPSVITYQDKTYDVTEIGSVAFYGCTELTSITLPNSLKSIGFRAFGNCQKLTSITIPSNIEWLGNLVFENCINLKTVTINSNRIISENRNSGLQKVFGEQVEQYVLGDEVQSIGDCAFHSSSLTSIIIPNSLKAIGDEAFSGCRNLNNIYLPDSLTNLGIGAFRNCEKIDSVEFPNRLQSINSYTFENCSSLNYISIPSSVTSIGKSAFEGCAKLTSIILNCNTIVSETKQGEGLNNIFGDQVNHYVLGDMITTIGEYSFSNCKNLRSITIPGSVKYIKKNAFAGCSSLNKVIAPDISAWLGITFEDKFSNPLRYAQHLYNDEDTEITDLILPEGIETIGDNAFYNCSGLNSITIPSSLKKIGIGAFTLCGIEKVVVSDLASYCGITFGCEIGSLDSRLYCDENTEIVDLIIPEGITRINGNAFHGFKYIKSVSIPGSLTSIGSCAFRGCEGLTKVIVPDIAAWCSISFDGYESNPLYWAQHIYSDNNTEITELDIPNQTEKIEGYAFYNASFLTKVRISNGVKAIGLSAFQKCKRMVSVIIPSSLNSIEWWAFSDCENLVKVVIPDLVAWCAISLNKYNNPLSTAHHLYSDEDTEIKLLEIPDGVTSISEYAFYECSSINSIILPRTVTSIGENAFSGCNGVISIWSRITAPYDIPTTVFSYIDRYGFSDGYLRATLYVPTGTKSRYESTAGWKVFKYIEEYDPTGIIEVNSNQKQDTSCIYNLNGKRMKTPQKGINIINGQKVIVK